MVLRYLTSVLEGYHIAAVLHASSVALANGAQGIALALVVRCAKGNHVSMSRPPSMQACRIALVRNGRGG